MSDYQEIIDQYYESGSRIREILIHHSRQVTDKALAIADAHHLDIPRHQIINGGMLHDIGIFMTDAPVIECHGDQPYICHGIIGASLLRSAGYPEYLARIAERHTGAGLTRQDILNQNLPLPLDDYLPETMLEKLICYADKFFSKSGDMLEKPLDRVRASMARHGHETLARFDALTNLFA